MFEWLRQLEFEHPARLYALLVVPLVLYFGVASATGLSLWRRIASSLCRGVLLALLIVAWSGIAHRGPTSERFTVFVTDRSASVESSNSEADQLIQAAASGLDTETIRYVNFGAEPEDRNALSREDRLNLDPMGSDPGAAVLLAAASCPPDHVPQMVLQTDGRQTAGDLFGAAAGAGIPIHVHPLPTFAQDEVCVSEVNIQSIPGQEGMQMVEVIVTANAANAGQLVLRGTDPDWAPEPATVQVNRGANRFQIPVPEPVPFHIHIELAGFDDSIPENNIRTAVVVSKQLPSAAFLGKAGLVADALSKSRSPFEVHVEKDFPVHIDILLDYDLVVIDGASAAEIGPEGLAAVEKYVRYGGGLLVMGDDATFGLEAYRDTALERFLPVQATEEVAATRATLAMLLVIDKSKSMEDDNRLSLAKEAAKRTVDLDLLTPQDKVGVLAFGNTSQWISPIVPCDNKSELKRRIDGLTAQGQTNMFPALQRAYLALTEAHADRRHVILMTDGVPSPGDFNEIAAKMAMAGITVSTVSIGAGADQLILKDISRIAGGRHIHCEAAEELTEKLVQEARSAAKTERQQHAVAVYRRLPDLDVASAPPLGGYVLTSPKPEAELLLLAGPGDPLLAWWRYGAGKAAAFTSTVGSEWGAAWQRWDGNAMFWSRVAELVARKPSPPNFNVEVTRHDATCRVTLDVVNEDATFRNEADVVVRPWVQRGPPIDLDAWWMPQVAPGRYEQQIELPGLGAYMLDIKPPRHRRHWGDAQRGVTWDYPDELKLAPADENLLRNVAVVSGGICDPTPEQISAPTGRTVERVTLLWRFLVLASLIVFVVEVGVRRA
jgi:Mg-chelatase subunit ChlD